MFVRRHGGHCSAKEQAVGLEVLVVERVSVERRGRMVVCLELVRWGVGRQGARRRDRSFAWRGRIWRGVACAESQKALRRTRGESASRLVE
eukprot:6171835-Pleurochrysis_carterae.AAC.3